MSDSLPEEIQILLQPAENHRPGPVVVHVGDPATMATITPRSIKRRGKLDRLWIVGGLAFFVFLGMFWENREDLNVRADGHSTIDRTMKNPLESSSTTTTEKTPGGSDTTVDVDAPPIPRSSQSFDFSQMSKPKSTSSFKSLDETPKDDKPTFSFLSWGQSYRFDKEMPSTASSSKQTKRTKKKTKQQSRAKQIPIIDDNDDHVPHAAAGAVLRAADALLCRDSVIDYVINATDLKDECNGLKKAYTKNCGGDEEEGTPAVARRRRRQLVESSSSTTTTTTNRRQNPLIQWQKWIHQKSNYLYRYWIGRSQPEILMIEDEILEEWDEALYEVQNDWDLSTDDGLLTPGILGSSSSSKQRLLNQAEAFTRAENRLEQKELKAQQALEEEQTSESTAPPISASSQSSNKTSTSSKEKVKLSNLALPTTKHHVSEKMLSETLLLQQEDHLMAHVIAATTNTTTTTTAAGAEAAKNAKAVSDTLEFVSSVLNDPSSVEARTCCTSILNVFHENCSVDEEDELSDSRLFIVVAVIALCGMVKSLIRHFQIRWLPEAAGCILVGVGSGWALSHFPHHDLSFDGPWFLRIMVPPIVFEAALSIDKRAFNRHLVPILFYAIIGTLLSTGLTAFFVHEGSQFFQGSCETIPLIEALTFGSLISSIDPIAVLSVLSNMGMTDTDTIYVVIFGESLLNDGIAIVLFQTLVHFLDDHMDVDSNAIAAATIHFLVVAVGSLLVGLGSGICCTVYYWAMHGCQTALVEVLMFCCWALIPYYVCDGIEWSGIVAVVAAGFVMDIQVIGHSGHVTVEDHLDSPHERQPSPTRSNRRERKRRAIFMGEGHLSKEAKAHIGFVTEIIATMMETAIFAYLGLFLFSSRYHWNNYHTMIAIMACCVSRGIMIPSLSTLANWITRIQQFRSSCSRYQPLPQQQQEEDDSLAPKLSGYPAGVVIDRKMQLVLWFAGLRGAMSFALVESIPIYDTVTGEGTRFKSELKAMTSACIMFTVFVLGGLTYYMMDSLGMAPSHAKEAAGRSSLEKEMEMVGLLSGSFASSKRTGDDSLNIVNDDEYNYEQEFQATEIPRNTGSNVGSTFRQRAQAS